MRQVLEWNKYMYNSYMCTERWIKAELLKHRNFSGLCSRARKNTLNVFTLPDVRILYKMESLPMKINIGYTALYVVSVVYSSVYH